MKSFLLKDIPLSGYFTKAVYLDENYILASPEMEIDSKLISVITEWGFSEIFSDGTPCESYMPEGEISSNDKPGNRGDVFDLGKIQQARKFYAEIKNLVESLYKQDFFDYTLLTEPIKHICSYIKDNRIYLMRVQYNIETEKDDDFLLWHTVRSTVFAIIIGVYLKLPQHRLMELGLAALLHEIGMAKLPKNIIAGNKELAENEKKLIYTHPIIGYKILKSSGFPLEITLAVLEHHERENGTGYPQAVTGNKLSLYSKIISVACSFEAILSKRPHKEAKDGYTGMVELLKNEGKQYNDTIIKALIYSMSLYPIGMLVLLSNDKRAQVIDVNPEDPRCPIVEILDERLPDGKNKTLHTSNDGIYIVRPLLAEETSV